jgi:hypothetical protein
MHESMDDAIYEVYGAAYDFLKKGLADGTITLPVVDESLGCACCRGEPSATILANFHPGRAFYFDEEEYKNLWGDEENSGGSYGVGEDGKPNNRIMASRKQVEEALSRSLDVQSML